MGATRGFLTYDKLHEENQEAASRLKHYKEFTISPNTKKLQDQGARCMDCGVPFCHNGCPLGNLIPDFNDAVYKNKWQKALEILHSTNNFPEFTGRLCPAPCEAACVLGIIKPPVSIELIEKYIVERGFKEGWIQPNPPKERSGKKVAIVGSGPAGLAAAQQLNRLGHMVSVLERDPKIGGLLRYGIPDFKLDKSVIDRRLDILKKEGIEFKTDTHVGKNYDIEELDSFDAVLLTGGATQRRDLPIAGSDSKGVMQAMEFLSTNNRVVDQLQSMPESHSAKDKKVIVIGGGDTGSDCVGTSNRHGAKSVINFELMPKPASKRTQEHPWPQWPYTLKTTSSHEEGVERHWSILTKKFETAQNNKLIAVHTVAIKWYKNEEGKHQFKEIEGTEKRWEADLVLLALGFTGAENGLIEQLGLEKTPQQTIATNNFQTNKKHVFAAGDIRRGQSLIVWAIAEGRKAAEAIHQYLTIN
ncbi:MAG: glutamate synthase subunit beta [Flavobacteriaceae bacterium]|nr:glutamate synthase subunit beta [Flavobacteriaceae bacterium]